MSMTPQGFRHTRHNQLTTWVEKTVRDVSVTASLTIVMVLTVLGQGWAAEWSVQPSLMTKGLYNSNLVLNPKLTKSTYGFSVTPGAEFAGKTERLEVSGRLAAEFIGYFGATDKQITNVFVPLKVGYKTEKDLLEFSGGLMRDNTLLNELQTTGVALIFTQRNQWTANPTWTRSLTEKLSFQVGAQFLYASYDAIDPQFVDTQAAGRLVDHRVVGGSGGFLYKLTERDELQLTGSYGEFHTFGSLVPVRASFPGVSMSVTHAFDESLRGTVYGGPKFLSSTTEVPGARDVTTSDTVWVAGARVSKQFERAEIQVAIARDLTPSGFGLLITTNRIDINGSYDVSETITGTLEVIAARTSGTTDSATLQAFPDRHFVVFRPGISWKFHEWWAAELSYKYRWRDIEHQQGADSHGATLMFTYYPPKLSFSR